MTGAKGDSFGGASVHVGPDGWALCTRTAAPACPACTCMPDGLA